MTVRGVRPIHIHIHIASDCGSGGGGGGGGVETDQRVMCCVCVNRKMPE